MPPEHREQARQVFTELAGGERAHAEGFSQASDGSTIPVELRTNRITFDGRPALLLHVRDIRERWRAERELRYRVAFESLVARISTTFINLTPEKIDSGIDEALEAIGHFAEADRTYVVQFSERMTHLSSTHEWCAEGVPPFSDKLQRFPTERIPWAMARYRRREVVRIDRVSDLPAEAQTEREMLESGSIRARLSVPMILGDSVVGCVGFEAVRAERRWTDDEISLLKIVGEMFVNALQRQRSERALRRSERRHRALARIRKGLLEELEHRVKNNIAGLLSLVRLYARSARSVPAFAEAIEGKLTAMKTVHEIIASARWQSVDLAELISNLAHQFRGDGRLTALPEIDGPPLRVVPRQAAALAMIFQELLTNHAKHNPQADGPGIRIRWRTVAEEDHATRVHISWREPASDTPCDSDNRGVGLELIDGFARFELAGSCRFDFNNAAGLRCDIDCHLEREEPGDDSHELSGATSAQAGRAADIEPAGNGDG